MAIPSWETMNEPFGDVFRSSSWDDVDLMEHIILEKLDQIKRDAKDTWYGRLKKTESHRGFKPKWIEEDLEKDQFTGTLATDGGDRKLTVTSNLYGASPTRANLLKLLYTNAILLHVTAAGVMYRARVSAVDGSNPVVTIVENNSGGGLPDNGSSQVWRILGEPAVDEEDATNPRFEDRKTRHTASQIFRDTFQIAKSRRIQRMVGVKDETEHQLDIRLYKLTHRIASSLLLMEPLLSGGVIQTLEDTDRAQLAGFIWWMQNLFASGKEFADANLYLDMSGQAFEDIEDINPGALNLLEAGADVNNGDWAFWCNPRIASYLSDFDISERIKEADDDVAGYAVRYLRLKSFDKPVPIRTDVNWPESMACLYNGDDVTYGFIEGDEIQKGELPTGSKRYQRFEISGQVYGCVVRKAPVVGCTWWNLKQAA